MVIRLIELVNNYYKDQEVSEECKNITNAKPLGEYCVWGFFDALDVKQIECEDTFEIKKIVRDMEIQDYNGECNRKNIVCITHEDGKGDENFWKDAKKVPFLYITMIRQAHNNSDCSQMLKAKITEINGRDGEIAYYSYSHSEVIVVGCNNTIQGCMESVLKLKKDFNIFKSFTIFGIQEDVLTTGVGNLNEKVSLRLKAKVRSREKAIAYFEKMNKEIKEKGTDSDYSFGIYDTFGAKDMIIEINNVLVNHIFPYYITGNELTHANNDYNNIFFNVETQVVRKIL